MTHTPGPWRYVEHSDGTFGVEIDGGHQLLYDLEGSCPQCFGNMRLISRAPELLDRLKDARTAIASLPNDALGARLRWHGCSEAYIKDDLLDNIDAEIAKAEGTK